MSQQPTTPVTSALPRCKPYPEYNDSGVEWLGRVPAHWEIRRMKFLSRVNPTKSEVKGLPDDYLVSFLPMENVGNGTLNLERTKPLSELRQGTPLYISEGDVIVAKITPCFENGKGALALGLTNSVGFGTTELHVIRPNESIDRWFLYYLTMSHLFRDTGTGMMQGTAGQKRIPENFVTDFRVPLPKSFEQHAIADFLDRETAKIDVLVAKEERLIELLMEKRIAIISHAVTKGLDPNVPMKNSGIEWLGEIPAQWDILQLRRVVDKFLDYRGKTPEKVPGGIPLVTASNIKNGRIDFSLGEEFIAERTYDQWMTRGLPETGDVLITTEAPLGEIAQVDNSNIALAQRIILLKVNRHRILNEFLKFYFASRSGVSELWSRATGSTALGIKAYHLKETLVTVPPLFEQEAITTYLNSQMPRIDQMINKVREAIHKLKEYRIALISAAVTGKIDVRGEL